MLRISPSGANLWIAVSVLYSRLDLSHCQRIWWISKTGCTGFKVWKLNGSDSETWWRSKIPAMILGRKVVSLLHIEVSVWGVWWNGNFTCASYEKRTFKGLYRTARALEEVKHCKRVGQIEIGTGFEFPGWISGIFLSTSHVFLYLHNCCAQSLLLCRFNAISFCELEHMQKNWKCINVQSV